MTSPLGFKARVGSALFAIFVEANVMYIPQDSPLVLHLLTSWQPAHSRSLPHMHVQRWDLARFRTCNRTNRRRTRYHCASDPASAPYISCFLAPPDHPGSDAEHEIISLERKFDLSGTLDQQCSNQPSHFSIGSRMVGGGGGGWGQET